MNIPPLGDGAVFVDACNFSSVISLLSISSDMKCGLFFKIASNLYHHLLAVMNGIAYDAVPL